MEAMKDLRIFILIMVILFFVWLLIGGPLHPSSKSGWFLNDPLREAAQKMTIQTVGKSSLEQKASSQSSSSSQSSIKPDFVVLKATMARETDPNKEYVEIKADNKNKNSMKITGWKLKGKGGFDVAINGGTSFVYAEVNIQPQEDVYLKPGEKAVIITGTSPLGISFKLNKCAGYFEQFHEFAPEINTECPLLKNENLPSGLNDACLDYIDRVFSCQTIVSIPYTF